MKVLKCHHSLVIKDIHADLSFIRCGIGLPGIVVHLLEAKKARGLLVIC